jgi:hypothetical protein
MRPLLLLSALGCATAFLQSPVNQCRFSTLSNLGRNRAASLAAMKMNLKDEHMNRRSAVSSASAAAFGALVNGLAVEEARAEDAEIAVMKTTAGEMVGLFTSSICRRDPRGHSSNARRAFDITLNISCLSTHYLLGGTKNMFSKFGILPNFAVHLLAVFLTCVRMT